MSAIGPKAEVKSGYCHQPRWAFAVGGIARRVIQAPKPEPRIMRYACSKGRNATPVTLIVSARAEAANCWKYSRAARARPRRRRTHVFGEVRVATLALLTFSALSGRRSCGVVITKFSGHTVTFRSSPTVCADTPRLLSASTCILSGKPPRAIWSAAVLLGLCPNRLAGDLTRSVAVRWCDGEVVGSVDTSRMSASPPIATN
jgi:hypothetical protein